MPKGRVNGVSQQKLLDAFEKKIKKNMKTETLIKACNEFKSQLEATTKNLNSIATRFGTANTIVKNVLGEDKHKLSFEILRLPKEKKQKQIKEQKEIYMARLGNRPTIEFDTYVKTIDTFKKSNDVDELIACVSLVTGRRCTEIVRTGTFTKTNDEHFVTFSGQLKAKGMKLTRKPYDIPLVRLNADELLDVVQRIRNDDRIIGILKTANALKNEDKANKKVASVTNKKPNEFLKTIFGLDITTEAIRGAYSFICYRLYGDPSVSEALYITRVLGHVDSDVSTASQHYSRVFVKMEDFSSITNLNRKMDELIKLVKLMVEKLSK